MNAPANIEPRWAKYLPAVDAFAAGRSEVERRHRANLMLLRDLSQARRNISSWEAAHAFEAVAQIAGAHALSELPIGMLGETRRAVTRLYLAAEMLEMVFETPDDGR